MKNIIVLSVLLLSIALAVSSAFAFPRVVLLEEFTSTT